MDFPNHCVLRACVCFIARPLCVFISAYCKLNQLSLPVRRSGASSSCSSYYSTSAAKAQLLSQMKEFTDNRERDEDDELTYKVTPAATVSLLSCECCTSSVFEYLTQQFLRLWCRNSWWRASVRSWECWEKLRGDCRRTSEPTHSWETRWDQLHPLILSSPLALTRHIVPPNTRCGELKHAHLGIQITSHLSYF